MPPNEPAKLPDAPIAEGRTAELYEWGPGQILKLYRPEWSSRVAVHEAHITRLVHASGLLVPAVGDLIEINGRAGLVFERADGPSLWDVSRRRPWMLVGAAPRLLATLHASLHRVT